MEGLTRTRTHIFTARGEAEREKEGIRDSGMGERGAEGRGSIHRRVRGEATGDGWEGIRVRVGNGEGVGGRSTLIWPRRRTLAGPPWAAGWGEGSGPYRADR